jgi:hypothetical protein
MGSFFQEISDFCTNIENSSFPSASEVYETAYELGMDIEKVTAIGKYAETTFILNMGDVKYEFDVTFNEDGTEAWDITVSEYYNGKYQGIVTDDFIQD